MRRATPTLALLALLVAGCGRGCGCGRAAVEPDEVGPVRRPISERFVDIAPTGRLTVLNRNGAVRVHGADVTQVRVGGEIEARSPFRNEAKAIARARSVRIGTDRDGRVLVEARPPRGRVIGATLDLDVTVPRGVDVLVETLGRGAIDVEGTAGPLEVRSGDGPVRVRAVTGPVRVATKRGAAVEVSGAPPEVHVDAAGAADVTLTTPRLAHDSAVTAHQGAATVTVPAGFAAVVDLVAPRGVVRDAFSLPRTDGGVAGGTLGAGGARLTVTARRGDVALRRR